MRILTFYRLNVTAFQRPVAMHRCPIEDVQLGQTASHKKSNALRTRVPADLRGAEPLTHTRECGSCSACSTAQISEVRKLAHYLRACLSVK